MPDLDDLLTRDVEREHLSVPDVPALDHAIRSAQSATRRRHAVIMALAAGTVAAVVGAATAAAMSAGPAATHSRLAAYDHVLGSDSKSPEYNWVIGPKDEHTAHCVLIPGTGVEPQVSRYVTRIPAMHIPESIEKQIPYLVTLAFYGDQPRGPYYLFRCPK